MSLVGEEAGEGTEIQALSLFTLMKAFEKAMQKYSDRVNEPVHTVVQYNYTMETSRGNVIEMAQREKNISFEKTERNIDN